MSAQKRDWKLRFGERLDLKREYAGCREEIRLDEKGRRQRVMVYCGDYYRFTCSGDDLKRVCRRCALLSVLSALLYALVGLLIPAAKGSSVLVLGPELLTMIPFVYLFRGLWVLCRAEAPFEQKVPLLSVRRMKSSGRGAAVLLALTLIAEAALLCVERPAVTLWSELLFFLLLSASIGCLIALRRILNGFHLEVVGKAEEKKAASGN